MSTHRIITQDGVGLAVHELGEGPPVLLLHGFMSSARGNWFAPRLAQALAAAGRRVIAPDARGHGDSDAPTAPEAWPPDVMARDVLALVEALDLRDYDLVGYSMGARTAIRACVGGLRPRRLVTGGMGARAIMREGPREALFVDAIRHGAQAQDSELGAAIEGVMSSQGLKPDAMLGVLASFHPTTESEIAAIGLPALVILGEEDHDNGSAEDLARLLGGRAVRAPGDHGSVVSAPAFRDALLEFLA